jgi:hypothetical protein
VEEDAPRREVLADVGRLSPGRNLPPAGGF